MRARPLADDVSRWAAFSHRAAVLVLRVDGIDLIARFTDGGGKYSWSKDCTEGAEDRDAAGDESCVPLKEAIDSAIRIPSHAQVKMPTASPPFPTASPPF